MTILHVFAFLGGALCASLFILATSAVALRRERQAGNGGRRVRIYEHQLDELNQSGK